MKMKHSLPTRIILAAQTALMAVLVAALAPGLAPYEAAAQVFSGSAAAARGPIVNFGAQGAQAGRISGIPSNAALAPALTSNVGFAAPASASNASAPSVFSAAAVPALAARNAAAAALPASTVLGVPSGAAAAAAPSAAEAVLSYSAAADGPKASDEQKPSAIEAAKSAAGDPAAAGTPSGEKIFDGAKDAELVAFRLKIRQPGVYLLENEGTKDDSVGRKLTASLNTGDIKSSLSAHSVNSLSGKILYVTGVEMGSEQDALKKVNEAVSGTPGAEGVKIQVLSIPRPWSAGVLKSLRDRIVYFMPSMRRD